MPKFFYLCEDGVWGVRKACADVFMPVSCVCSPSVRKAELAPLFVNLLRDQSRWVRMAAYQALGPFISTFADPSITALLHNDNGEIVVTEPGSLAKRLDELEEEREAERLSRPSSSNSNNSQSANAVIGSPGESMDFSDDSNATNSSLMSDPKDVSFEERRASSLAESGEKSKKTTTTSDVDESYNSFNYWREPLPTVEDQQTSGENETKDGLDLLSSAMHELSVKEEQSDKGVLN